jgi:hypothetical protein
VEAARRANNAARPLGPPEELVERRLRSLSGATNGHIDPTELLAFGSAVGAFDTALEKHVLKQGWFRERPSSARSRWGLRGGLSLVLGIVAVIGGSILPSAGLVLVGGSLIVAGIAVIVISRWMDAVTMSGAMIRAMLAAYRRTLEKTMAQARSMNQVVAEAGLDWLKTPDQAVVWGTALGLEKRIEDVLSRSLDDVREGRATSNSTYFPVWYAAGAGGGGDDGAHGIGGGGGSLLSSSALPDFGGMMSALGTIGNSPASSGSGGSSGGGFSGGGSGGGGGGSGGGF